ncbi:hypothetical protein LWM68_35520 [Niabella sp. W65]|nr:hypothetical protein [Niabella sp. W65]MCH7367604.1 hypothetical protein [Niabella sp. W65]ULT43453.1 hypothetical protein KRR40_08475 [Niabella sp. I65]
MNDIFLKTRAYPYIHDVATYMEQITFMKDGQRKLPLSSSPEYNDNAITAWFTNWSNFDLSLVQFLFKAAAEVALANQKLQRPNTGKNLRHSYRLMKQTKRGLLLHPDRILILRTGICRLTWLFTRWPF